MAPELLKAAGRSGGFFYDRMIPDDTPGERAPMERLSPRIIRIWQWVAILRGALPLLGWGAYALIQTPYGVGQWGVWVFILLLMLLLWVVSIRMLPIERWRRWRFSIDRNQIELSHGIWFRRQTVIPLNRVQHVDTRQGPLLRQMKIAAVAISTAATVHEIPALSVKRAQQVRQEISNFARLAREDV